MNAMHLISAALVLLPAVAGDNPAKKEQEKLQGAWTIERLDFNGQDVTDKYKFQVAIKGNRISVEGNDAVQKDYGQVEFKLDPRTTPPCIDLTVSVGGQKGATLEGIYQVKGNELKLCVQVFGNERPGKFESPAGKSVALVVLKKK